MSFWTSRRGRQFLALVLIVAALGVSSALVAYADSATVYLAPDGHPQAQGDASPTATLVVPPDESSGSTGGVEAAVLGSTQVATPTNTPTPAPVCTPPLCKAGEVYYCPGSCPGGCGTQCATPTPGAASAVNVIVNGGFEQGFVEGQGVGVGWGRFQNGNVNAGWYDDTWFKVVYEGKHAQLLELRDAREMDRYVGIFQTVSVVPNAEYDLTLHGLVRSDSGSPQESNYGFRLQYGIDYSGATDWQSSNIKWIELMWDEQPRQDPKGDIQYRMESHTARIKTTSDKLTLFIRGWKKWPDAVEGNYDVDGVSLVGPQRPGTGPVVPKPTATAIPGMPETGDESAILGNPVLVVASAVLLVVLAGGAVWGVTRRRT